IVDVDPHSPNYGQLLATLNIGKGGSDELDYDPIDHKVYFTDVSDQEIGVADAVHNTLIKTFTGIEEPQIEQPRYNPGRWLLLRSLPHDQSTGEVRPADRHAQCAHEATGAVYAQRCRNQSHH